MRVIGMKTRVLSAFFALLMLVMVCIPGTVYAEGNASVVISADKNQVEEGDKVTITVTVTGDSALDKVNYAIVYDKAVLSIKDSEGYDFNGKVKWAAVGVGANKYVENFEFTALKDGVANIHFAEVPEVSGFAVTAGDPCVITVGSGVQEVPQESTAPSSDAEVSVVIPNSSEAPTEPETEEVYEGCDLKELIIQPGTIEFDPEVTDYVVRVEAGTDRMLVQAETADPTAQYVVSGFENLKDGEENLVSVIVTSTAGDTKTYNIHVLCGDAVYYEEVELISGEKTYIAKEFPENNLVPGIFTESSIEIDGAAVNVYQNEEYTARGLYLIYAAEGENRPVVCWYNSNDGMVFPYVQVGNPDAEPKLAEVQNAYAVLAEKYNKDMSFRMKVIIGLVIVVAFVLLITLIQMFRIHRLENKLDKMEEERDNEAFRVKEEALRKAEKPAKKQKKSVKKEVPAEAIPEEVVPEEEPKASEEMATADISAAIAATMEESVMPSVQEYEEAAFEEEEETFFEEVKKVEKKVEKKAVAKVDIKDAKLQEALAPRRPTRERPQKPQVTRRKED